LSRFLVTAIFVGATVMTAVAALDHLVTAASDPGARSLALAGYWVLRTAVVAAFSFFVAVRDDPRKHARSPIAFVSTGAALGAMILLRPPSAETDTTLVLLGDMVALASYVWLVVAVLYLGRCFGLLPEARGLVTRGPYRLVRHPVYLGEFGAVAGFLIGAPTLWNLAVAAMFVAAQAVRMRLEERALAAELPQYAAYAAGTPRLLPRFQRASAGQYAGSRAAS
jgi:protein-S-isoprenylcysteine O-methyltransferase Ste14